MISNGQPLDRTAAAEFLAALAPQATADAIAYAVEVLDTASRAPFLVAPATRQDLARHPEFRMIAATATRGDSRRSHGLTKP